jgi:hypothetical protein
VSSEHLRVGRRRKGTEAGRMVRILARHAEDEIRGRSRGGIMVLS